MARHSPGIRRLRDPSMRVGRSLSDSAMKHSGRCVSSCEDGSGRCSLPIQARCPAHRSFAYSALACLRTGRSGSAVFHNAKNIWYADLA